MGEDADQSGHRQRLRERFLKGGDNALADYELLELILYQAIPRRDTKSIAKALLREFKSFAGVVGADPSALRAVDGVGDAAVVALKAIGAAAKRLAHDQVVERPVLGSWDRLIAYLKIALAHATREEFRVLFLDAKNALLKDEAAYQGTVNQSPVYPREIVKQALELHATAIIMVHNHPSGDPTPSAADIAMTKEVRDAAAKLGIVLHDHVVIARTGTASFRSLGLL
jgi:DNA repair protein RadC